MHFSKLFLLMVLGVSLNNSASGMNPKYSDAATEQLLLAIKSNNQDLECIQLLLEGDDEGFCADPNMPVHNHWTLLRSAACSFNTGLTQLREVLSWS